MKFKVEGKTEFDRFDNFMRRLVAVQHGEIKTKLDAERKAKKKRMRLQTAEEANRGRRPAVDGVPKDNQDKIRNEEGN